MGTSDLVGGGGGHLPGGALAREAGATASVEQTQADAARIRVARSLPELTTVAIET